MNRLASWLEKYEVAILSLLIAWLNFELALYKSGGSRVLSFVAAGLFALLAVLEIIEAWKWGDWS